MRSTLFDCLRCDLVHLQARSGEVISPLTGGKAAGQIHRGITFGIIDASEEALLLRWIGQSQSSFMEGCGLTMGCTEFDATPEFAEERPNPTRPKAIIQMCPVCSLALITDQHGTTVAGCSREGMRRMIIQGAYFNRIDRDQVVRLTQDVRFLPLPDVFEGWDLPQECELHQMDGNFPVSPLQVIDWTMGVLNGKIDRWWREGQEADATIEE